MTLALYAGALAGTIALEALVVRALAPAADRAQALRLSVALNLLTHPLATLALLHGLVSSTIVLEVLVVSAEALGYRAGTRWTPARAGGVALAANAASALAGLLLSRGPA